MKRTLILIGLLFLISIVALADEYYFKNGQVKEAKAEYVESPYLELTFLENPGTVKGMFIYEIVKVRGPSSFLSDVYRRSYELLEKGNLSFYKGDFSRALDYYQQALDINPVYIYAYHNRAVVFAAEGKYDEAAYEFKKMLKRSKDNPGAYFNLGVIYRYLENWRQAKFYFEKARWYFSKLKDQRKAKLWSQKTERYIKEIEEKILERY